MWTTRRLVPYAAVICLTLASGIGARAGFQNIRIGDVDGFGYTPTTGLKAANGADADTNHNGLLENTEFLPDLNHNGSVATGSGDDFDHRSAAEIANTLIGGSGFTDLGTTGSKWTDISLSTSFSGPNFPDPTGPGVPNDPIFDFKFHVAAGDIVVGSPIFFNLIFGDYDVVPANVDMTFASAPGRTIALTTQGGNQDGLIQAATANLAFNEVFTSDGSGGWNGLVNVKFDAPNEPYTAFDYSELSVERIAFVPEPASLLSLGLGALTLGGFGLRRRKVA